MSDHTWASVYWMYSLMALFATGAAFFLWRAIRSGAVSGDEAPKYRMLIDDPPDAARRGAWGGEGVQERQQTIGGVWGGVAPPEQESQTEPWASPVLLLGPVPLRVSASPAPPLGIVPLQEPGRPLDLPAHSPRRHT